MDALTIMKKHSLTHEECVTLAEFFYNAPTIPMAGMPWNIPGGVHSPDEVPAKEWVDRDNLYHMTHEG